MTQTSRFAVAWRPGRVRSWVVTYVTQSGSRATIGRYLSKDEAEQAIATLASNIRQEVQS